MRAPLPKVDDSNTPTSDSVAGASLPAATAAAAALTSAVSDNFNENDFTTNDATNASTDCTNSFINSDDRNRNEHLKLTRAVLSSVPCAEYTLDSGELIDSKNTLQSFTLSPWEQARAATRASKFHRLATPRCKSPTGTTGSSNNECVNGGSRSSRTVLVENQKLSASTNSTTPNSHHSLATVDDPLVGTAHGSGMSAKTAKTATMAAAAAAIPIPTVHPGAVRCSPRRNQPQLHPTRQWPLSSPSSSSSLSALSAAGATIVEHHDDDDSTHAANQEDGSIGTPSPILNAFAVSTDQSFVEHDVENANGRFVALAKAVPLARALHLRKYWIILWVALVLLVVAIVAVSGLCIVGGAATSSCPFPLRNSNNPASISGANNNSNRNSGSSSGSFNLDDHGNAVASYLNSVTLSGRNVTLVRNLDDHVLNDVPLPPEELALYWLVHNDILQLWPDNAANQYRLRQRYALLTLLVQYHGVTAETMQTANRDYTRNECSWPSVSCRADDTESSTTTAATTATESPFLPGDNTDDTGSEPPLQQPIVTAIHIDSANVDIPGQFRCSIPPDLGLLTSLTSLTLIRNTLFGTLPSTVGLWTDLEVLNLTQNDVSGTIPPSVGNWRSIRTVSFFSNRLSGSLPTTMEKWFSLEYLNVAGNQLQGTFPSKASWPNVSLIHATDNKLSGTIPSTLSQSTRLEYVDLSKNALTGTLPEFIGLWTDLKEFDVAENPLTGTLPTSTGRWTKLDAFRVGTLFAIETWDFATNTSSASDGLKGTLDESIGNWTDVCYVSIQGPRLIGSLPDSIGRWTRLIDFHLFNTGINGTIPDSVGNWSNVQAVSMVFNMLSGTLPTSIGQWTAVELVDVADNRLSGTLPNDAIGNWTRLNNVRFASNQFAGTIADETCQQRPLLEIEVDCTVSCSCCSSSCR